MEKSNLNSNFSYDSSQDKILVLWCGYHHEKLQSYIEMAWTSKIQLIILPPNVNDFNFLKFWKGEIHLEGQWDSSWAKSYKEKIELLKQTKQQKEYETNSTTLTNSSQKSNYWPEGKVIGLFTSGTVSGTPRLVLFSKKNLLISLESIRKLFETSRIKKIFCYPQPTHVFGLVLGYLQSYLYNTPLYFLQKSPYSREAHKLWHQIADKDTLTLGTPAHFNDLITWLQSENLSPNLTYSCIAGGAPVSQRLWKRLKSELNIEAPSIGYGATEASLGISHLPPGEEPLEDNVIGSIFSHVSIHQMNQQGLIFSGPNLADAIWNGIEFIFPKQLQLNDIIIEKSFNEDKLIKNSPAQYFVFAGRSDLLINRGGLKISPESLENILESELGINSIVIGYPNERLGHEIGIIYESKTQLSSSKSLSIIQDLISTHFGFKLNSQTIIELSEGQLPKSLNGKKDRSQALKMAIRNFHPFQKPISIELIKSFMPHRQGAIWIDRIVEYRPHFGRSEVDIKKNARYFPLTGAEAIEWVAQTYGYSRVVNEIYGLQKLNPAQKTLIAELKSFENLNPLAWESIIPSEVIEVVAICTHDFDPLFVIEGEIFAKKTLIAKVELKVYAGQ